MMASQIAKKMHGDQRDPLRDPVLEHLVRVAAAVPSEAQRVAWLHDAIERTPMTPDELRDAGLTDLELEALALLSREPAESYELYALRIAFAAGGAGRLARRDSVPAPAGHIAHGLPPIGAPPYRWARRHIAAHLV